MSKIKGDNKKCAFHPLTHFFPNAQNYARIRIVVDHLTPTSRELILNGYKEHDKKQGRR